MNSKSWYKSKTIWSNIVVLGIAALGAVDQQFGTQLLSSPITNGVLAVAGAFGIYGRAKAKTEIG